MEIKARDVWPDLVTFEDWVNRNCINCRWRYRPNPDRQDRETCSIAAHCLIYHIKDQHIPQLALETVFGEARMLAIASHRLAPWMCNARLDKRGRQKKKPAF